MSHFFQFRYNDRLTTISLWEVSSVEQYWVEPGSEKSEATPAVVMNNAREYNIAPEDAEVLIQRLNELET